MSAAIHTTPLLLLLLLPALLPQQLRNADALGFNWGTRSSHPLPPDIVVRLLRDNGVGEVKLFEAEAPVLKALGRSGIQVMLGIPNEYLAALAGSVTVAEQWVMQNVSTYISKHGVDIRYVAVGNEPFLKSYKGMFQQSTFPALQNIEAALVKAGLGRQVKVTVPLNADIYQTETGLPSGGNFRSDIRDIMISIVRFLQDNGGPLTINIYPFLSLYADPNFPKDYAFFSGTAASPIVDGSVSYANVFEANYDTLMWALEKNGFSSVPVVVGEIGWPTDGDANANVEYARKFNQGLLDWVRQGKGSPKRSNPPDVYLFGLIDEDIKSVQPGNFERHWGVFYYDGTVKYPLTLDNGRNLVPAKGVRYLDRKWCVLAPGASVADPNAVANSTNYACTYADCTSLGYGSSCNGLDARSNVSYAFNQYYQTANQQKGACAFNNLAVITNVDPSQQKCKFEIMIDIGTHEQAVSSSAAGAGLWRPVAVGLVVALLLNASAFH